MSAGTVIWGAVLSFTVTLNEFDELLLWESVALQLTVVSPNENVEPEAGVQFELVTVSSESLTVTVYETDAPPTPVAFVVMSAGTVIWGAVVSATVTLNEAEELLPWESVALQLTDVVPNEKIVPEAGEQFELVSASSGSLKVTVYETDAPLELVAELVMSAGTPIAGTVLSFTVTLNDAEEGLL